MSEAHSTIYNLTLHTVDFRWSGATTVPSHRRLSDSINDTTLAAIVLNHASSAIWINDSLRELDRVETIAVLKRNILMVVSSDEMPAPPSSQLQRVQKIPQRTTIHLPSFTVVGDLNILPNGDWLHVLTAANQDFFAITKAKIWRTKTGAPLETNLKLLLVNRQRVIAMEANK